jgi:hypothetical protein
VSNSGILNIGRIIFEFSFNKTLKQKFGFSWQNIKVSNTIRKRLSARRLKR